MSGKHIRIFHASAASVFHRVFCDHDEAEFLGVFANTEATGDGPVPDVVGYGDIHDPYLENDLGRTLLNVGSVGNCLGDPVPSYVILEGVYGATEPGPFSVQFVRLPYDVEAELAGPANSRCPRRNTGRWSCAPGSTGAGSTTTARRSTTSTATAAPDRESHSRQDPPSAPVR